MSSADRIRDELARAARALGAPEPIEPLLERPRDPQFGEWATNYAMTIARPLRKPPRDVAASLLEAMNLEAAGVAKAEIAGPGFINFWLAVVSPSSPSTIAALPDVSASSKLQSVTSLVASN